MVYQYDGLSLGYGSPTERLAGYVDCILQPGMKSLPSFLKDTIHTLQLIEETNDKISSGDKICWGGSSLWDINWAGWGEEQGIFGWKGVILAASAASLHWKWVQKPLQEKRNDKIANSA